MAWCEESTKLLLDKYEQYLALVGPMKQFKCKKNMWIQIAEDIKTEINIIRTATQCENQYKTILKRKNQTTKNNQQSGAKRVKVEFEEELNKIKAIDDSLEPEIMQSPGKLIVKSNENVPKNFEEESSSSFKKKKKTMSINETLWQIQTDKEEKREKRHKEKLELLKNFMKVFNHKDSDSD